MKWIFCFLLSSLSLAILGQSAENYEWKNVPIGGGGYITGMKIHPLDASKRYYRTDVGGAYRWDPVSARMKQMVFSDNKNHYSVAGIALHPTDTNIIYLAVGRNCKHEDTAILKSVNGGLDFAEVQINGGVAFHFAANGGRQCDTNTDTNGSNNGDKDRQGSPLEINPHNPNELYIGSREQGVFILDLSTYELVQIPSTSIPYNSDQLSIRSIVFHPLQEIVYIAYAGHGVYVGDLNTQNYVHYGGVANTQLLDAIDLSISKDADYLLAACKTQGIMKATNLTGNLSWTQVSGLNPPDGQGYLTADCSPHDNDVAITVVAAWGHINEFQVTTDAASNWQQISGAVAPEDNVFPWKYTGFASHVAEIAFDPADASSLHFTSWFGTFACDNFTTLGPNSWHNRYSKGHEEIVTTDLVAFPVNSEGNFLMAGSGDHSGFLFDSGIQDENQFASFDISRRASNINPLKKCASMDFCEKQSDHLVVCITEEWSDSKGGILTSEDGGLNWSLVSGYDTSMYEKALVAMSSDNPDNIIAYTGDQFRYTLDGGNTFLDAIGSTQGSLSSTCTVPYNFTCLGPTDISGSSLNSSVFADFRNIAADKNFDCVFYFYDWNGDFSTSTDGGATWCIVNNSTLPASPDPWEKCRLYSIPGYPGHLWININKELWHSADAGVTWTNYSTDHAVDEAAALSFGKGLNSSYVALYIFGKVDGETSRHFYRSDDRGINWVKINDHMEKEIWGDNKTIAGDRNIAGRLYASASGQGVLFADRLETVTCDNQEKTIKGEFTDLNSPSVPEWTDSQIGGASMLTSINQWGKAVLDIDNPGVNNYDLQLWQDDLVMDAGKYYLIQLDLRADDERGATVKLRNRTDGTTYLEEDVKIHSSASEYSFVFVPSVADTDLRLTLMVGGSDETIYMDHIRFREFCLDDFASIECNDYITLIDHELMEGKYQASKELLVRNASIGDGDFTEFEAGDFVKVESILDVRPTALWKVKKASCPE